MYSSHFYLSHDYLVLTLVKLSTRTKSFRRVARRSSTQQHEGDYRQAAAAVVVGLAITVKTMCVKNNLYGDLLVNSHNNQICLTRTQLITNVRFILKMFS